LQVADKKILVVGGARSGIAAARFLAARGARVTVNDLRPEGELDAVRSITSSGIHLVAGGHPLKLFENADLIVVSPGVPLAQLPFERARERSIPVISEVELAARFMKGQLIGITGSNGKTTTTTLTGLLLARAGIPVQVGGNIGTPLISLVEGSRDDGFTVIEMSSFQLEAVDRLHFQAAALLNISPDHLDRYRSMDEYADAKGNIFRNQTRNDTAVLNGDDGRVVSMASRTLARQVFFSRRTVLDQGIFLKGDVVVERANDHERELVKRSEIGLKGDHNLENVMAALGLGLACGASSEAMRATVAEFRGVEHRLEFVREIGGVEFYNDSKATNVDAAIKALESFDSPVVVILGGKDKGSDYTPLRPLVASRCRSAVVIGAAAGKIAGAIEGTVPVLRAESMAAAVEVGFEASKPGDVVLLAPACASFDMFENYEDRGRVFKDAVLNLARGMEFKL
jgi:UDP-N-acetylmuramoylalanine--D-glutamate ligase